MSPELRTYAELAVVLRDDGRIELAADIAGGTAVRQECPTANTAARVAAGIVEAAIRAAGHGMHTATLSAIAVTIQVRDRELSLAELKTLLQNVR